ncbi:MAG: mannose-1-phosphate guanylyltransferase [bacterium]
MKLFTVILCGGRGERFWPRSRRRRPKQFISLFGSSSLTRRTSDRMLGLCPLSRQLFVAPAEFRSLVKREVHPRAGNLVLEPVGRNTAPAIGLAAAHLARRDPTAVMVVLPADHLITGQRAYEASVRQAVRQAEQGRLVTFGIPPTRPDTGYGYIQLGERLAGRGRLTAHRVRAFREKPDARTARRYLASGDYLWNSGMFVWRVDAILEAFRTHLPGFHEHLAAYGRTVGTAREAAAARALYRQAPAASIDYAVMEKADNIAVVRASFGWDDVGSWLAVGRHDRADARGNVPGKNSVLLDSDDCIVDCDRGVVALLGVRGLVVVRAGEAVLVAHRDRLDRVRDLLRELERHPVGRKQL